MRRGVLLAALPAVTMVLVLGTDSGFAQTPDDLKALRKDIETLKDGQTAIQKEVQEIRSLLQARPTAAPPPAPAPQEVVLSLDGAPVKGSKTAKVVLVDFTDYQ